VLPIFYDCPMCGKAGSSYDGEIYCGSCEEKYQEEQAEKEKMARAEARAQGFMPHWPGGPINWNP